MRILCPVDSAAEAAELAALGADELYGGYLPPGWEERFGLAAAPPNRRSFAEAQIRGEEQLAAVVATAHAAGARFLLTVNAPVYAGAQHEAALELVAAGVALGVDAFIAADAGLVLAARERLPGARFHVSTLADVANHGAAAFWARLGAARITLPRHLSTAQLAAVVAASPGVRFDAFVLYGQCPNAEGHCTFPHDHPRRVWPCVQRWRVTPGDASPQARAAAAAQGAWSGLVRADACGLCALRDLARIGLDAVKIVGRGAPTERKRWAVRTVRELLAAVEGGIGREDFLAEALRRSRERFTHGCDPRLCYFPEFLSPRGGGRHG